MTTLPEEAVKAAEIELSRIIGEWERNREYLNVSPEPKRNFIRRQASSLTAALPHLPGVGVKKLEWELVSGDHYAEGAGTHYNIYQTKPDLWNSVTVRPGNVRLATNVDLEAAKAAAQADYEARILSALEPSAARELALEEVVETLEYVDRMFRLDLSKYTDWDGDDFNQAIFDTHQRVKKALRALSSPDHADAGKVEGDARADLERFWRPISEADRTITYEDTFNLGDGKSMTIRNSDHFWVRDADGRVYEATWSDHKGGYWWDLEGESRIDPVEYMPHPLSLPSAPASEGA